MPTLYLIALPTENLDDISLRALRLLRETSAVAAADRPALEALLAHHAVSARQIIDLADVLTALAAGDVVLIGVGELPGIADDSGAEVIGAALARGIRVEPIPGVSLAITAMVLSALPPDRFIYAGRLSASLPAADLLKRYEAERATLIVTARADHVPAVLRALRGTLGDRPACIVYRPGAPDGVILRGSLTLLAAEDAFPWRADGGDAAFVIGGATEQAARVWDEDEVRAALRTRLAAGEPLRLAAKALAAETGWDRRRIYALGVDEKA
ncbi:MAG: SAM-dependent methyltransferase [Anaerolineae bacterium]|nr:SAM-dependent methyltransferase [Anaerolineae bacterium]NUQ04162.1 hypothetical protein [Anaerolineae bacterium]